jgi:acid phosphatase (class A)
VTPGSATRRAWALLPLVALLLPLAAADRPAGYLGGATVDITGVVPPPPVKGDIRYETDRRIFRAMKRLIGSARWAAATRDVDYATPAMEQDFACATGLAITPERMPVLTRLINNASADTGWANNAAKDRWQRLRPFHIDAGETCQDKRKLGDSYDYPSGHTTKGWTMGLVLADVMPDRADPILARARAYGESRIVCRVHNYSAVENGRLGATVSMATVRETPAYLADLTAARAEVAAARNSAPAPDPAACAAQDRLLGPSVLTGLRR